MSLSLNIYGAECGPVILPDVRNGRFEEVDQQVVDENDRHLKRHVCKFAAQGW